MRAYPKRQRGYGYAETHLHDAYPSWFNVLGHSVWRGCIYDGITSVPSFNPLPAIFQPRIYYGFSGSAMDQLDAVGELSEELDRQVGKPGAEPSG